MRDGPRVMVEIARAELAYAQAEVSLARRMGAEKRRIAHHLAAVSRILAKLKTKVEDGKLLRKARRATGKHRAPLRPAKSRARIANSPQSTAG